MRIVLSLCAFEYVLLATTLSNLVFLVLSRHVIILARIFRSQREFGCSLLGLFPFLPLDPLFGSFARVRF